MTISPLSPTSSFFWPGEPSEWAMQETDGTHDDGCPSVETGDAMAAVSPQLQNGILARARRRLSGSRPIDLARNAAVLGLLWYAYSVVRTLSGDQVSSAFRNAGKVLTLQERVGMDIEAGVQSVLGFSWLFRAANWYYLVHFPVTVAALVVTYAVSRNRQFVVLRNSLIGTTSVAVLVHARYPLAPPRMLEGYLDSALVFGPNPYMLPGSEAANQYAAMPSMHVGWAVLVGLVLWNSTSGLRWKALGVAHASFTSLVVVLTANHYVLDVIIGAAMAVLAWRVAKHINGSKPAPSVQEIPVPAEVAQPELVDA